MATISSSTPESSLTSMAVSSKTMESAGSPSGGGSIHVLASLRKHRRLALIVAAVIAVLGLPAAYILGTPKYIATAVVYVSPRFMANLADNNNQKFDSIGQYREYVAQNVKTINRFDIVLESLNKLGGLNSVWVKKGETLERAASRLQGALIIEEIADTYQIAISLEGKKKTGLAELVNTVADTYLEKAKSEEFFDSDQRVQSLLGDRARLQKEIADKQARRLALAQELGVSSFTDNDLNPYDRLLVTAKEAESDAQKNAIQAETQLAAFDEKQHPGARDALRAYALIEANKDPALTSLMTNLNVRRAQVLESLNGLSPEHPGRHAAERELADIEKERQAETDKVVDKFSKMLLDQRTAEAYQARSVERQLAAEVDRQASQASWFTRGYQEGIQLGLDVDELRKSDENLQQRIDYFTLEKSAPGFVRLFSAARTPDQPIKGMRKVLFAVFLALALICAVVVPVGIDFLDPRVHSPSQVEGLLGFPPILWLMDTEEAGPGFEKEQVLRLASRLGQDRQSSHSRVFAFTSVKSRGGTSTLVMKTARALTSLGVPALAVEANAYRSDPRYSQPKYLGPGSRGLTAVLTGSRHLHQEVIPGDEEMPDRIPAGGVGDETNLPDTQNLGQVLRQAAETYDVVVVDTPPILASVDAEIVACSADVVILVIEAGSVTKQELRRAAKTLERLNIRAISALLNKVRTDEPTGLAAVALNEFLTGSAPPASRLLSPWLWR
jgi:Mrp family chromosome partitioning ATPase/capsular polysaccharide biosynthesis protein